MENNSKNDKEIVTVTNDCGYIQYVGTVGQLLACFLLMDDSIESIIHSSGHSHSVG